MLGFRTTCAMRHSSLTWAELRNPSIPSPSHNWTNHTYLLVLLMTKERRCVFTYARSPNVTCSRPWILIALRLNMQMPVQQEAPLLFWPPESSSSMNTAAKTFVHWPNRLMITINNQSVFVLIYHKCRIYMCIYIYKALAGCVRVSGTCASQTDCTFVTRNICEVDASVVVHVEQVLSRSFRYDHLLSGVSHTSIITWQTFFGWMLVQVHI